MLESEFEKYLLDDENITSKEKAVATRMSKARTVEDTLKMSLDTIVSTDIAMFHALLDINSKMKNKNGAYSNALRKYYTFKNNKTFPQIDAFERENIYRL
jgi:hypothetical protein